MSVSRRKSLIVSVVALVTAASFAGTSAVAFADDGASAPPTAEAALSVLADAQAQLDLGATVVYVDKTVVEALLGPLPVAMPLTSKGQVIMQLDSWWNPFSWSWSTIWNKMKQCGTGAALGVIGRGAAQVSLNVARQLAGRGLVALSGGGYAYVGFAVGGCIVNMLS